MGYLDEIWASLPEERAEDEGATAWALRSTERAVRAGNRRLLDLGCGDGRLSARLAAAGAQVVGVDPSHVALERARAAHPQVRFVAPCPDGRLPLEDNSFDVAVCVHVLQHVADVQTLLSETRRVLRPGAALAVAVPSHGLVKRTIAAVARFERSHDPLEPVLRFYSARSMASLLEAFDFEDVQVARAGGMPLWRETLLVAATRP
jgi:ubiquinone/menaquinone biosynthesis C-methylase UbiE